MKRSLRWFGNEFLIFRLTHFRMEDLLQNIIKESSGKQLQNLKQAAQIAHGESSNASR